MSAVFSSAFSVGASSAQASACPTMQIAGVRGSGETSEDYGGFGRTVSAVVDAVKAQVPAAAATPIDYPAIPVEPWKPTYNSNYVDSVRAGVAALQKFTEDYVKGPCGTTTFLYYVGYSQGAQVAGDAFQKGLSAAAQKRVAGVSLIGDPKFKGSQKAVNVGNYEPRLNGVQDVTTTPRTVSGAQTGLLRSFCLFHDPVCSYKTSYAAACTADSTTCPHFQYVVAQVAGTGRSYTLNAADWLVSRWRVVGPPPPSVGARTSVLLLLNGGCCAGALQTALTDAGYAVTPVTALPADLSAYGQVWWYGLGLDTTSQDQLVSFARSGGSVFLSGEYSGCCTNPDNKAVVASIFNSLVTTVGGLQFGPDDYTVSPVAVNSSALYGTAALPSTLTTLSSNAAGTISASNIDSGHFLFRDSAGNGEAGIWGPADVIGGGRLAIVMDTDWLIDAATAPAIVGNLAYFLSGATT